MIQDRTSVFPIAFTELAFGLSDELKVTPFTFYQVSKIFGVARYGVRDFSSFVGCNLEARKITDSISCHSKNLIYLIECKRCHLHYIRYIRFLEWQDMESSFVGCKKTYSLFDPLGEKNR